MPRLSLKHEDAATGGLGVKEGNYEILKSVAVVHQFPPNRDTKEQGDPFVALRWDVVKLNDDHEPIEGSEDVVFISMGKLESIRPGMLAEKDIDNPSVEPEDLGTAVGTEGNSFFTLPDAKASKKWGIMEESLRSKGFPADIVGRGYTPDYAGLKVHFITIQGEPYLATKGAKKGEMQTAHYLKVDKILYNPFDQKQKAAPAKAASAKTEKKTNGAATEAEFNGLAEALKVFGALSPDFKNTCKSGESVTKAQFIQAITKELFKKKTNPKLQTSILNYLKKDDNLITVATELVGKPGAFMLDTEEETLTFE